MIRDQKKTMDSSRQYRTLHEEIYEICFTEANYPSQWLKHKECPCCGDSKINYTFSKFGLKLSKCQKCLFIFLNPYPDGDVLNLLYGSSYYTALRKFIEIPKATKSKNRVSESISDAYYLEMLEFILRIKAEGKWLDVGGGIGSFLAFVKSKAPQFNFFLNEKNPVSTAFAKEQFGLSIHEESPQELFEGGVRFDVISMIAVLEHISKPKEFFEDYARLLNPGGVFFINVPRYSRFNRWFCRQHTFNVIPPYHLCYFEVDHLLKIADRSESSLKLLKHWLSGNNSFQLQYLAYLTERYDIEIPTSESDNQKTVISPPLTSFELKKFNILDRLNSKFSKVIKMLDGEEMINIAFQKV